MSMGFASTSPRHSPASCTTSTVSAPSSTPSVRTRCSRRSSSSPSRGMSAAAATRSAISPRAGTSGTTSTAILCGVSGKATVASSGNARAASPASPPPAGAGGRKPHASVNFITAHDGFTLEDLVSYNDKHNEANGEDNRDGSSGNDSWNCGVEGPTDNPVVLQLRERQKRNFLVTLMLSQGV